MKYALIILGVLAVLFGVQLIINKSNKPLDINMNQPHNSASETDRLIIEDTTPGSGKEAQTGNKVTVNYTGMFTDGKVFDSSIPRGQPFSFVLGKGSVIKGWDEGLVGMKEGGHRRLTIPPALGYGQQDYSGIPGGSTLIFDIELLKVE